MTILTEIYQFLFISSIIFILYILGNLSIKMYGRFKLDENTRFVLNNFEKVTLWVSITILISYLI